MTVKELKATLEQYPDNMDVFVDERRTDFYYGLVNSVTKEYISFMEEPNGKAMSRDEVVMLSEE